MIRLEKNHEKLYYSIGDVADMMNVNTSLIRYWEKEFSSLRPKKNMSGTRMFTKKDIEVLKYIYHLVKVEGHTLDGAKKIIRQKDQEQQAKFKSLQSLEKIKSFLVALRSQVDEGSGNQL
jgi:DNA-binding transcriptional MerR regulator